jgi:hypothetical protein
MPFRVMWRFLLAGLLACCGLVLLFIASFGDPTARLRDLHTAFAAARAPETQAASASTIEPPAVAQVDQGLTVAAVAARPGCSAPQLPLGNVAEANAGMAPAQQSEPAQRTASAGRQDNSASRHQQSHKRRSAHHQSTASLSATRQAGKATPRKTGAGDRPLSRRNEDRHSPTDSAVPAKDVETRDPLAMSTR